jgi:hypothetical protein
MSDASQDAKVDDQGRATASNKAISTCPKCGTKIPDLLPSERCPVCQLQGALDREVTSSPTVPDAGAAPGADDKAIAPSSQKFDHYELLTGTMVRQSSWVVVQWG